MEPKDPLEELESGELRHTVVENEDVVSLGLDEPQRLSRLRRRPDVVAVAGEIPGEKLQNLGLIVDDENLAGSQRSRWCRG